MHLSLLDNFMMARKRGGREEEEREEETERFLGVGKLRTGKSHGFWQCLLAGDQAEPVKQGWTNLCWEKKQSSFLSFSVL